MQRGGDEVTTNTRIVKRRSTEWRKDDRLAKKM
jgi:hypothetical protein